MKIGIPYYFFNLFKNDTSNFIYQGEFNESLIERTIQIGENSVRRSTEYAQSKKKISFLIAECLQNVIRYEEKPKVVHQTNNRPSTFMVRNIGNAYYIISSNLIQNEKVDDLKNKLKKINNLDQADLKTAAKKVFVNKIHSKKDETGLGLVELAKKSDHKLEYDFEHVNFYLSCFYLQVKLIPDKGISHVSSPSLANAKEIYKKVLSENVIVQYKGNFSQQSILPILGMIENHLKKDAEHYYSKKKVFYFLVELLQNMSKHAFEKDGSKEGVVVICKKDQVYSIYCGNFIALEKTEELKKYLERIGSMDRNELSALYQSHLSDGKTRAKGGAGLGLIDMIKYSAGKPVFDFRAHDNESAFYSFGLSI